jgi:2-methylisocitrate lyase-like PEP mutase family enzyme
VNPEAVRQRAAEAARQRAGRPATPDLDPAFVVLNRDELPVRGRSGGELAERVRRAEDYATLGARVVVELHTESHATKPTTPALGDHPPRRPCPPPPRRP